MDASITIFNEHAKEYDEWFDKNQAIFDSELAALSRFVPRHGDGLDIGVGTGRFAKALGIKFGIEPAPVMRTIAQSRGIEVIDGMAESLPFPDGHFDFTLFVTTLCFIKRPIQALMEARRVLKPSGRVIIGIIHRDSTLGKRYEKSDGLFYKTAHFISGRTLKEWLKEVGFDHILSCQTLIANLDVIKNPEIPIDGHGKGCFSVFSANKRVNSK